MHRSPHIAAPLLAAAAWALLSAPGKGQPPAGRNRTAEAAPGGLRAKDTAYGGFGGSFAGTAGHVLVGRGAVFLLWKASTGE